jgi:hypothetical protein
VISLTQGRYLHTERHKHRTNTYQTSMPWTGFEPTITALEREKTVHALDRAATVIGFASRNNRGISWLVERLLKGFSHYPFPLDVMQLLEVCDGLISGSSDRTHIPVFGILHPVILAEFYSRITCFCLLKSLNWNVKTCGHIYYA